FPRDEFARGLEVQLRTRLRRTDRETQMLRTALEVCQTKLSSDGGEAQLTQNFHRDRSCPPRSSAILILSLNNRVLFGQQVYQRHFDLLSLLGIGVEEIRKGCGNKNSLARESSRAF